MKRDKKFDWFKVGTILMVVIGVGGFLLLFFLGRREKQEFDRWLTETQQAIQKATQSSTAPSSENSIRLNMNDDIHNEPNNELVKQTDNEVKTQEMDSPTKADLPPDQEDTFSVDEEEAYYAQFDEEMSSDSNPLDMVGIPRPIEGETAMYFKPTDVDLQRQSEIEAEAEEAARKNLLAKEEREGFFPYPMGDDKTVYVHPDFLERYDELANEYSDIQERSMREGPANVTRLTPYKSKNFPDGTRLTYYRRRNGDLIRSLQRPDGTVRKWIIGWTDLTPYGQQHSKHWRAD